MSRAAGLQEARETGEGAAGRAGEERAGLTERAEGERGGLRGSRSFGACARAGATRRGKRVRLPLCPGPLIERLRCAGLYARARPAPTVCRELSGCVVDTSGQRKGMCLRKVELPGPWWVLSWKDFYWSTV